LQEGADAFGEILAAAGFVLGIGLVVELVGEVGVQRGPEGPADQAERLGAAGQLPRQVQRARHQLRIGNAAVDQAPVQRLGGRQALAQQGHLHGPRPPDHPRQKIGRAAVGDQADAAEGLQEIGALAGDDQVAHQGEGAADTRRRAVHRRDDRDRQVADQGDQRIIDGLQRVARAGRGAGRRRA
jgi:hypothetical protein